MNTRERTSKICEKLSQKNFFKPRRQNPLSGDSDGAKKHGKLFLFSMPDLTLPFIISQIAMFIAMGFDFLSLQYKKREHTFLCLIVSASFISAHYFLLNKIAAGVIVFISVLRFITCYFTTNKKYLFIFIALNTISLFFTYKDPTDFIIYVGLIIFITGNFQEDNKLMRKLMMSGTSLIILYNAIIFSPMDVIAESSFLISGIIGYYRFYIKK